MPIAAPKTARRIYLIQRLFGLEKPWLGGVWRYKQEAQPGTPLPDTFPSLTQLASIGYTMREDLDGADVRELELVGLTRANACAVLKAFASLT